MDIINGWLEGVRQVPSPNFNVRPEGGEISLLVVHAISLPPGKFGGGFVEQFFLNKLDFDVDPYFDGIRGLEVSAHCFIDRDGAIVQFVSFEDRAWHAGVSSFDGVDNCNNYSIGIELEGTDDTAYTAAQYDALARLTTLLRAHYPAIQNNRVVGHCDIAPDRKTDPGQAFNWSYFRGLI